jgi:hypothetical protein
MLTCTQSCIHHHGRNDWRVALWTSNLFRIARTKSKEMKWGNWHFINAVETNTWNGWIWCKWGGPYAGYACAGYACACSRPIAASWPGGCVTCGSALGVLHVTNTFICNLHVTDMSTCNLWLCTCTVFYMVLRACIGTMITCFL